MKPALLFIISYQTLVFFFKKWKEKIYFQLVFKATDTRV